MEERHDLADDFDGSALRLESDAAMDDALSFLRGETLDPSPINVRRMEIKVLRQWRHEQNLRSWKWWLPFAAALAVGFLLAALCLNLLQPIFIPDNSQNPAVAWPELKAESDRPPKS